MVFGVEELGSDAHVLALPAGDRRMANVRKLMRMAREYEADEGRDLRGFIDFVAERDLIQDREGEAPLEAEELDAVRLMTVHRAKGLEFPVVCVADLGKTGREDTGSLRISSDGEVGLRLASMSGGKVDTAELERIKKAQKLAGEEEERRIFYVAATRAEEHLILSGATDLETRPDASAARRADGVGVARALPRAAHGGRQRHPRRAVRGPRREGALDAMRARHGRRSCCRRPTAPRRARRRSSRTAMPRCRWSTLPCRRRARCPSAV